MSEKENGENEAKKYIEGQRAQNLPIHLDEITTRTGWTEPQAHRFILACVPVAAIKRGSGAGVKRLLQQ